jgi:hypothetical protein
MTAMLTFKHESASKLGKNRAFGVSESEASVETLRKCYVWHNIFVS